jgi:hypothetical protein
MYSEQTLVDEALPFAVLQVTAAAEYLPVGSWWQIDATAIHLRLHIC